jgi:hypothetical protein
VVRTPSGREPASAIDPAVAVTPGQPPAALAPWSTLVPADDAACRSDAGGWRVTLQTLAPWIALTGVGDLRGVEDAPALLRVRWSAARICLEGVELRSQDLAAAQSSAPSGWGTALDAAVESWVVARFAGNGTPSAGRVAVVAGGEARQPLECKLSGP